MARLEKINNTTWKQPFRNRKKEFHLWGSHSEVAKYCKLLDGTKRLLQIQFESHHEIDIIDKFQITSGKEISFSKGFQDLIKPIILNNPNSYFLIKVLDVKSEDENTELFVTTGSATVKTRIGQAKFRRELIDYWKACAVTGVDLIDILMASHIKPWAESTDLERLDKYNGLLLNPMLDSLFDKGFITFSDIGEIIFSPLIEEFYKDLGVDDKSKLSQIESQHKIYLKYHRDNVFQS